MRDFNFEEWKKHPEATLMIEESVDGEGVTPRIWTVLKAVQTFEDRLAIHIALDAMVFDISSVVIPEPDGAIYDDNGHLIGRLKFAPAVYELWGITFQYENVDNRIFRRLLEGNAKIVYPYFLTQQAAFNWMNTHDFREYVGIDYNKERCSMPQAKLIDTWIE